MFEVLKPMPSIISLRGISSACALPATGKAKSSDRRNIHVFFIIFIIRNYQSVFYLSLPERQRLISFNFSTLQLRSEEHTSELQSRQYIVCRLLLEKKKKTY